MSGHGETAEGIKSDAFRWIIGAGGAAVLFSLFLVTADYRLSHSNREQVLGATLKELREAQSQVAAPVRDNRVLQNAVYKQDEKAK